MRESAPPSILAPPTKKEEANFLLMFLPFFGMLLAHLEKQVKPDKNLLLEAPPSLLPRWTPPFWEGQSTQDRKETPKWIEILIGNN